MPKAGRPEKVMAPSAEQLAALVHEMRELRRRSGLTYRELVALTGLAKSTLSEAASGRKVPTWPVTRAYAVACGGDDVVKQIRALWQEAVTAAGRPVPDGDFTPSEDPPDPGTAEGAGDFVELLRQLRAWANGPSLSTLNARSGGYLPPSTVSENLNRNRLPRLEFVLAFASACGLDEAQVQSWKDAWTVLKSREDDQLQSSTEEAAAEEQPPPPDPYWLTRSLRSLILVDEETLDQVPDERKLYTAFGGGVLLTAIFSALGALGAVHDIVPMPWTLLGVPGALALALTGVVLDRSIIRRIRIIPGRIRRLVIILPRILTGILIVSIRKSRESACR